MSKKASQHEMIQEIQSLAIDLGKTPTRDQYVSHFGRTNQLVIDMFGSFATFVIAAGLDPVKPNRKKITSDIFLKDIYAFLPEQKAQPLPVKSEYEPTLFIGDIHFPFADQQVLEQIYEFAAKMKPKNIIQCGDLYDAYSHAKFPRSHNVFTPRDETKLAREMAENFWKSLQKASSKSRFIQMLGNHDVRPLKRVLEVYPEAEDWIAENLKKIMTFENVETIFDPREELLLPGNVFVFHGYLSQFGKHRDFAIRNVVCGHSHVGAVGFKNVRDEIIWELNVGYCGDPSSKGLSYTSQKTVIWTKGWGWLDEYGPRFIPAVGKRNES